MQCRFWNPHLKRDVERIEKVQRRATKCINGMQHKSYQERLHVLGIDSLLQRRCVFDLVELFKIIHNLSPLNFDDFFSFMEHNRTRGHQYKLAKNILIWIVASISLSTELLMYGMPCQMRLSHLTHCIASRAKSLLT